MIIYDTVKIVKIALKTQSLKIHRNPVDVCTCIQQIILILILVQ